MEKDSKKKIELEQFDALKGRILSDYMAITGKQLVKFLNQDIEGLGDRERDLYLIFTKMSLKMNEALRNET